VRWLRTPAASQLSDGNDDFVSDVLTKVTCGKAHVQLPNCGAQASRLSCPGQPPRDDLDVRDNHDCDVRRRSTIVSFLPVTPNEMHAAQILTGATMALWIIVGLAPGVKAYATEIRVAALTFYLLGFAGFVIYVLLR
jgi:hypothetical protein